jgi:DNA-binding LacI/PurR family transcriptional regulator
VPDDVAVIGFDNTDEGLYTQPTLTTVDPGRRRIAVNAVDALVRRIADRTLPAQHIEVEFSIVEREST